MLSFVCSGLASAASGFGCETVGKVSGHQQCQEHDNFKLLLGSDGDSLLAVRGFAMCATLPTHDVSGEIRGQLRDDIGKYWQLILAALLYFQDTADVSDIDMNEDLEAYRSLNKQTLGELFLQFLFYYSNFE